MFSTAARLLLCRLLDVGTSRQQLHRLELLQVDGDFRTHGIHAGTAVDDYCTCGKALQTCGNALQYAHLFLHFSHRMHAGPTPTWEQCLFWRTAIVPKQCFNCSRVHA
ncbi:unnamed protein product [Ectocarpus sp. 12 AP-2014]